MPVPARVVYIYYCRSVEIFGGKLNQADVFAGRRQGVTTVLLMVKKEQLSMCWSHFRTDKEASSTPRLIGLEWLSTSHPDQLAFLLSHLSPWRVKG